MPSSSSSQSPDRPPRTPNGKRRSTGSLSTPLQTISESQLVPPPPIPAKSNLRNNSISDVTLPQLPQLPPLGLQPPSTNWLDNTGRDASTDTRRTAPPAYERIPAPGPTDNEYLDNGPVEGEKLAALRGAGGFRRRNQIGWLRIGIAIAILCIIALAVGLGVGLTSGGHKSNEDSSGSTGTGSDNSTTDLPFPLGTHSIVTVSRTADTGCTFDAATWRCFPYSIYDPSDSNSTASQAVFSWLITNTSSTYATNKTGATATEGIPANLTISSTGNPFGIVFPATNLTYISSTNSSSARYVFSITQSKAVLPSAAITTDNTQAECFYNQTIYSGTLYLSAARTYPSSANPDTTNANQWPYAVDVAQTSPGGSDTPACYDFIDGAVGARITNFTTPFTAETSQCTCDYNNFDL